MEATSYTSQRSSTPPNHAEVPVGKSDIDWVEFYSQAAILYHISPQQQGDYENEPIEPEVPPEFTPARALLSSNLTRRDKSTGQGTPVAGDSKNKFLGYSLLEAPRNSPERNFIYACALILSRARKRPNGSASNEVTATALAKSEQINNASYTLYIAKNGHTSDFTKEIIHKIRNWVNERDERRSLSIKKELRNVVILEHSAQRIESYLRCRENNKFKTCFEALTDTINYVEQSKMDDFYIVQFLVCLFRVLHKIEKYHNEKSCWGKILESCHEFTLVYKQMISYFKACLEKYEIHPFIDNPVLFCIDSIEKLARIPQAFDSIEKFRHLLIDKGGFLNTVPLEDEFVLTSSLELKNIRDQIDDLLENDDYGKWKPKMKDLSDKIDKEDPKPGVHCEMKLIAYLLSSAEEKTLKFDQVYDFIGCSKGPCYLCAGTINYGTPFQTDEPHWKLYWRWGVPEILVSHMRIKYAIEKLQRMMDRALSIVRDDVNFTPKRPRPESVCLPLSELPLTAAGLNELERIDQYLTRHDLYSGVKSA
ncbi:hypothetical protein F4779DRAFT_634971 [Xylariaceae sp. FL0662B]|nr:hypothetical protein F4779DRAFT_634971 [Xylariaceae sp. FL0662B]